MREGHGGAPQRHRTQQRSHACSSIREGVSGVRKGFGNIHKGFSVVKMKPAETCIVAHAEEMPDRVFCLLPLRTCRRGRS